MEPEFLSSGSTDIDDLLREIEGHADTLDDNESDEELADINKQWIAEAKPPTLQDDVVLQEEQPLLLESAPPPGLVRPAEGEQVRHQCN